MVKITPYSTSYQSNISVELAYCSIILDLINLNYLQSSLIEYTFNRIQ